MIAQPVLNSGVGPNHTEYRRGQKLKRAAGGRGAMFLLRAPHLRLDWRGDSAHQIPEPAVGRCRSVAGAVGDNARGQSCAADSSLLYHAGARNLRLSIDIGGLIPMTKVYVSVTTDSLWQAEPA
jgi:hypothetical protein